jgi:hypothetical protein
LSLGQRVEEGGFAHVGQAHDAYAQSHDISFISFPLPLATHRAGSGADKPELVVLHACANVVGKCKWNGCDLLKRPAAGCEVAKP